MGIIPFCKFQKLLELSMINSLRKNANFIWIELIYFHTKVDVKYKLVFNVEISIYSCAGFFIYFMQITAFYLFCRKSSNIFDKNLRTRSSVEYLRTNKWKIPRGNKWGISTNFCVKKWYLREKMVDWGTKSSFFPRAVV